MKNKIVTLIGSGNLAWHLAPALDNAGYPVREVYSRNLERAVALTGKLYDATPTDSLDFRASQSGIFIIALRDDAVSLVAATILLPAGAVLVHTSGTLPLSVLGEDATPYTGVLYPIQTFSKTRRISLQEVPILIESPNADVLTLLTHLAKAISKHVSVINSQQRSAVHLAAVFANNFANFMFSQANLLLEQEKLPMNLLYPLIAETTNKVFELGPIQAQTGPARRGDLRTLDKQLVALESQPEIQQIYKVVSQGILDLYHPQEE